MSRKCRLRSYKSIGEDGKWAADRIEQLEAELSECQKDRDYFKANDRCAMGYLSEVRNIVGGKDFPDMVKQVAELQKQRDELLAALEQIASGEDDNGSILSGGECQRIAYDAIANIKESK